ncbi:MAG: M12 family metallo-peptidase [Cellvibrionaceae bacterium]
MNKIIQKTAATLFLFICHSAFAITELGVHFIVDSELGSSKYTMQQVERLVSEVNNYYVNSGVSIRITPVKISHTPLNNNLRFTIKDIITGNPNNYDDISDYTQAHKIARTSGNYGASYVYALVADGDLYCGFASQVNYGSSYDDGVGSNILELSIGELKYRTAASRLSCDSDVVAHELGHLMGLGHGNKAAECLRNGAHRFAVMPTARGWAEGNCDRRYQQYEFATIMVNRIGIRQVPVYSGLRILNTLCGRDHRCGDSKSGDAVSVMNYFARSYGNLLPRTPSIYDGD